MESKSSNDSKVNKDKICLCCKTEKIEYMCLPCQHHVLCRKCAMKMATGGKCKVCGELFPSLKRIVS